MAHYTISMMNADFNFTDKVNFTDFNVEEVRGWVINEMCKIENEIDQIIIKHFEPKNTTDFKKILLNSSILAVGAKTKILSSIPDINKNFISNIQKISSIRNAFAHQPIRKAALINVESLDEGTKKIKSWEVNAQLEVMNSSGTIKTRKVKDLCEEFLNLNSEINNYITNIKKIQPNR
jgi:hypothetical protein